ncbi:MAG: ATP-grasp domain-containing protein [Bacillota bacterium]
MRIFILEYFLSKKKESNFKESFYREGKQILISLIKSFSKLKDLQLSIFIDQDNLNLINNKFNNVDFIILNSNDQSSYFEKLINLDINECDYFLIIAPETNNLLYQITKIIENKNINNLGCSSNCIKKAANKWLLYNNFKNTSLQLAESYLIGENVLNFNEKFFPAVIKAKYSAGSELKIINSKKEFKNLNLKNYKGQIIQKIIKGIPGSLSLAANSKKLQILSLNKQLINPQNFSYLGSTINYKFPDQYKLEKLANLIKKEYPNLNGYFGIDFIYNEKGFFLLEINPRITSSFIGLSKISNPAKIILDLARNKQNINPDDLSKKEFSFYLN